MLVADAERLVTALHKEEGKEAESDWKAKEAEMKYWTDLAVQLVVAQTKAMSKTVGGLMRAMASRR